MLTPEELTQARALSSPEIPDDDETAKQPTRQLVRKMLAHIDAQKNSLCIQKVCFETIESCIPVFEKKIADLQAEIHAALDAKETAEACREEAEAENNRNKARWQELQVFKEKAEADCQVWCERHNGLEVALSDESAKVAKLQAIVDSLNPKGATPDYWLRSKGWYEIGTSFGGRAWCSNDKVYAAEPMTSAILYQITREAALSAAASSGAKEKQ